MSGLSLTFGEMPSREQFDAAWDETAAREREESPGGLGVRTGTFGFGRDPRMGDCRLTRDELWDELVKAHGEYVQEDGPEDAGGLVLQGAGVPRDRVDLTTGPGATDRVAPGQGCCRNPSRTGGAP